ncbi:toll/interleukin-1 receptor domain-containing protein [Clostridium cibarium]|uniref:Toll/interleukin-1 receptor domain-containing protein n=1 Tax=Clostridium cibarium TaxID=2762247 RepID=A0ABR8PPF2_9CLOT|nr:toll/interleukin-1 receptor domain-containing protein [Clostridium cibarium]MBD7910036.1 toll/interleukin-1 receptor domain-containing protein [Clostridium cibarium]
MPKVFISYSHDSQELEEKVKNLADILIQYGVNTEIDQYTTNPVQGWPQYMLENILSSDYILCVCTENYKKRFENEEKIGVGLGAKFEGKYITQILYADEYNKKVIPILFAADDPIPLALQPYTHYKLYQNLEFEKLYRYVTRQPLLHKPELGNILSLDDNNAALLSNIKFGNNIELKKN